MDFTQIIKEGYAMAEEKKELRVAIVGLGRVGNTFLQQLAEREGHGIKVVAVAENNDSSPGIQFAQNRGISVYSDFKEIVKMGDAVDVIFELTGDRFAKMELRGELAKSGNTHTVIAPEVLAFFIWDLIAVGKQFPV
jgi:glyceraldehyde-3-phosphate dehydrogenase/erythrose-4-phosphate dehydrogenase